MDLLLTAALALALTFALAVIFGRLAEGRVPELPGWSSGLLGADGLAAATSLLLTAAALALLPWPLHPSAGRALVGRPLLIWAAVEGAFLAPLLPALLAPSPLAARAAMREAQIGVAGRAVVWLSVGVALFGGAGWEAQAIPGRALVALAGALALPAAAAVGPFAPERSLSLAGAEEGLDEDTARLLRLARTARGAALLAALVVASLPLGRTPGADGALISAPASLAAVVGVFAAAALAVGRYAARRPRTTLPAALRWCWWRALPLALAGVVYLAVV